MIAGLSLFALAGADAATISWLTDATPNAIAVEGLTGDTLAVLERNRPDAEAWSRVFLVVAEPAKNTLTENVSLPPMAGTWRVEAGRLLFEPRFPLVHGVRYRAEFRSKGETPVVAFFELPAARGRPTEVVQIFPSGNVLPENQLKFYVQFSAPMSRGATYEHVHIHDAAGTVIDLPFLELEEELWDPAMTRLTLLIDPGRIKRGVKPLEDIGPVFESGKTYSLRVEAACRDSAGRPLRQKFEKHFRVGAADRTPPDPQRWKINPPKSGTRQPVEVMFDEPMDHALALRLIQVVSASSAKAALRGEAALGRDERSWTLVPAEPWKRGAYHLTVATTIEDLAGNNIGKTFDVDLSAGAQRRIARETLSVAFEVE